MLTDCLFPGEVPAPLLGLLGKVRVTPGARLVGGGPEAGPQGLGLLTGHETGLLPLLLDFTQLAGDLGDLGDPCHRFRALAQLFLDADVRPPLPLVDFAQLLDLRHQRRVQVLHAPDHVVMVLLLRQYGHDVERAAQIAEAPLGVLERQRRAGQQALDAGQLALQPLQACLAPTPLLLPRRALVAAESFFGPAEAGRQVLSGKTRGDDLSPGPCHRGPLRAGFREPGALGDAVCFLADSPRTFGEGHRGDRPAVPLLAGRGGLLEAPGHGESPGLLARGHRRQSAPGGTRFFERPWRVVGVSRLHALAQRRSL